MLAEQTNHLPSAIVQPYIIINIMTVTTRQIDLLRSGC
jgi:hypothetical protein